MGRENVNGVRRIVPLHERLRYLQVLQHDDEALLETLLAVRQDYPAGTVLQQEGSQYAQTRILVSGWALRYVTLRDGRRQIINFLLPGDTIGLFGALFSACSTGIDVLTDAVLAELPCADVIDIFRESPRLGAALCWIAGQDERYLEQQIVRIGRLNACLRIAHLFLELRHRLLIGGADQHEAQRIPLAQTLIADALGMSHVHANRSCRELQRIGLLQIENGEFILPDPDALAEYCNFDNSYAIDEGMPRSTRKSLTDF